MVIFTCTTNIPFSPDVILCGWLGSKHQLTNSQCTINKIVFMMLTWKDYERDVNFFFPLTEQV